MSMIAGMSIFLAFITDVGPQDVFLTNYSAIKVDVDYKYSWGEGTASLIDQIRKGGQGPFTFKEDPAAELDVEWSCDGEAEYLSCRSAHPELVNASKTTTGGNNNLSIIPINFEIISTNDIQAENSFAGSVIQVISDPSPGMALLGRGPFCWWGAFQYPRTLSLDFPNVNPTIHHAIVDNTSTDVAVYQTDYNAGQWYRLEVYHDPNLEYLPRLIRSVAVSNESGICKEMYLISARPCAEGGFVPTELYEAEFQVDAPRKVDNDQLLSSPPRPNGKGKIVVGHLRSVSFLDRRTPVALKQLDNVHSIAGRGGPVALASRSPLTLARLKSLLGNKLHQPSNSALPTLDAAELDEKLQSPRGFSPWFYLLIAAFVFGIGSLVFRKPKSFMLLFGITIPCWLVGCSSPASEDDRPNRGIVLSTSLEPQQILFDYETDSVPLTLIVKNESDIPIQILNIDGGCVCRNVDQSALPMSLNPNNLGEVKVDFESRSHAEQEQYRFTIQTDRGTVESHVVLTMFSRHRFQPEAIYVPALSEDENYSFEVTHRAVCKVDNPFELVSLHSPSTLIAEAMGNSGGPSHIEGIKYHDTKYNITLNHNKLGTYKDEVYIKNDFGNIVASLPITWRRNSFLYSTPEQAVLGGSRPVRVFLRCPDESVELSRILSAPPGVKAVISSVREVTIALTDDAPNKIDGFVEVDTTAEGRNPLRIPVIRYVRSSVKE